MIITKQVAGASVRYYPFFLEQSDDFNVYSIWIEDEVMFCYYRHKTEGQGSTYSLPKWLIVH